MEREFNLILIQPQLHCMHFKRKETLMDVIELSSRNTNSQMGIGQHAMARAHFLSTSHAEKNSQYIQKR